MAKVLSFASVGAIAPLFVTIFTVMFTFFSSEPHCTFMHAFSLTESAYRTLNVSLSFLPLPDHISRPAL